MFVNVDGSGMGTELWTLPYTPQELEGVWHYQCVDIGPIPSDMGMFLLAFFPYSLFFLLNPFLNKPFFFLGIMVVVFLQKL